MTQALELKDVDVSFSLKDPIILSAAIICSLADPELSPVYERTITCNVLQGIVVGGYSDSR